VQAQEQGDQTLAVSDDAQEHKAALLPSPPARQGLEQAAGVIEVPEQHPKCGSTSKAASPSARPENERGLSPQLAADKEEEEEEEERATPQTSLDASDKQREALQTQVSLLHGPAQQTAVLVSTQVPSKRCVCCFLHKPW